VLNIAKAANTRASRSQRHNCAGFNNLDWHEGTVIASTKPRANLVALLRKNEERLERLQRRD
jgi:hypothetical protein